MNPQQKIKQIEALIEKHQERLNELELQAAKYGIDTPPHINIEIKSIRTGIQELNQKLFRLKNPVIDDHSSFSKRILYVDDNLAWCTMVGRLLGDYQHIPFITHSVVDAENVAYKEQIDLAIIALHLQKTNENDWPGIELAFRLRDSYKIIVLLISPDSELEGALSEKINQLSLKVFAIGDIGTKNSNDLMVHIRQIYEPDYQEQVKDFFYSAQYEISDNTIHSDLVVVNVRNDRSTWGIPIPVCLIRRNNSAGKTISNKQ